MQGQPKSGRKPRRAAMLLLVPMLAALVLVAAPGAAYVSSGRTIWTIAGNGTDCQPDDPDCGDSVSAVDASLSAPAGLAVAGDGSVYVADAGANRVRRVTSSGDISTIAGTGEPCQPATAACGDGGNATVAQLTAPRGLALASDGTLYIAETGSNRIRRVTPAGVISTLAGTGQACPDSTLACGDGGSPTEALLSAPRDVALDGGGALYVADTQDNRIRRIRAGTIATVAGTGGLCVSGACGDGGAATGAKLNAPTALEADTTQLIVAESGSARVRRVALTEMGITTIAGDGVACFDAAAPCGDGGSPTAAHFNTPSGLALVGDVVYVADASANKVRRVGDTISTVAGNGTACMPPATCGDGGSATDARLGAPSALAVDGRGDLLIADSGSRSVRWLAPQRDADGADGTQPPVADPDRPVATVDDGPAATTATKPTNPAKQRVVRCSGRRCTLLPAGSRTAARLKSRARAAGKAASRVRVELRKGGRVYATGSAVTLRLALTLTPSREVRRGTYRLRITHLRRGESRRRNRIVRVR
jgi:hypothetical protein